MDQDKLTAYLKELRYQEYGKLGELQGTEREVAEGRLELLTDIIEFVDSEGE